MKATGIVRRIDELGRVVIPKEIRKTLNIQEGDALEIFLDSENGLILKPYNPEGLSYKRIAQDYANLTIEERQELLCELVNHLSDPTDC